MYAIRSYYGAAVAANAAVDAVMSRLTRPETVRAVIAEPLDLEGLDALLPHLATPGFRNNFV